MNQRFLMWGLASITFVVTAAVSSWNDGLWQSEETLPAPVHGMRASAFTADESREMPSRPFAPTHPAPAPPPPVETIAAVAPPPPAPAPEPVEAAPPVESSTQLSAQELDEADFQAQRERSSEQRTRNR